MGLKFPCDFKLRKVATTGYVVAVVVAGDDDVALVVLEWGMWGSLLLLPRLNLVPELLTFTKLIGSKTN